MRPYPFFAAASVVTALATQSAFAYGEMILPKKHATEGQYEIAPYVGSVLGDPWVSGIAPGASFAWHWHKNHVLEATARYAIYTEKTLVEEVAIANVDRPGQRPQRISRPGFALTGDYWWKPIYGKFALFGELVLRYDLFAIFGGGFSIVENELNVYDEGAQANNTSLETKLFPVVDVGVGSHIFLGENLAVRFDVRPTLLLEFIDGQIDPATTTTMVVGVSYFFGEEGVKARPRAPAAKRSAPAKRSKSPAKKRRK